MVTVKKRPSSFNFKCPNPDYENKIEIYPVIYEYKKKTYEAWAICWFEKGKIVSKQIKILYEGEEYTPFKATMELRTFHGDAWGKWRFGSGKGISLRQLAVCIYSSRDNPITDIFQDIYQG